jgi:hypothetical protein
VEVLGRRRQGRHLWRGAAEQKTLDFVGAAGFSGRSRADLTLARKFGFRELAGFSLRSLSDLSVRGSLPGYFLHVRVLSNNVHVRSYL